jgi:hypothetical protein
MIWQVVAGLLYSGAGFVLGFAIGRVTREVHEIKETVVPETFVTRDEDGVRHTHATKLGVVVIVLSLLTVLGATFTGLQAKAQADCQSAYNARFFEAFQARAKANDGDRKALNTMLLALGDPSLTRDQRTKVFNDYLASIRASDADRRAHPLPQPPDPRDRCAEQPPEG